MKYRTRLKLKYILYDILAIIDLSLIILIGVLADRTIEIILTIISFYILRKCYEKQFHATTLIRCSLISILVMGFISITSIPKAYSIFTSVGMSLLLTAVSYYTTDYITMNKERKRVKTIKLEDLSYEEFVKLNSNIHIDDIKIIYDYIHRPKEITCDRFIMNRYISRRTLFRLLDKVKENYEGLTHL